LRYDKSIVFFQIFGIFVFVALIVFCIFALAGAEFPQTIIKQTLYRDNEHIEVKTVAIVLIIAFIIDIVLSLWFLWVVCKCFIFFRDQANDVITSKTTVGYSIHVSNPVTFKQQ